MKSLFCMFCTLAIASSVSAQETGNAMLKYGLNFLKTPYVAHTLEVNEEEKLVVNFDEVDCTTFVEYVLALSLSPVKNGAIDKTDYARVLQKIRYRDGRINGYTSRLHYIADWINNGVKHGFMEDVTAANSPDSIALSLNFMSSHPKSYRQLASSPENVSKIESIEKALSGQTFHYIPKAKLPDEGFSWIKNGDIIDIDIPANTINVRLSDEELEERRKAWTPREPKITTGYLARYASLVTSGNRGAVLEVKK